MAGGTMLKLNGTDMPAEQLAQDSELDLQVNATHNQNDR
jgi:hypothetical protein